MKPAREPASSRPRPCVSLKNAPSILPVRRSVLVLVGRKQTALRVQLFAQKPPGSRLEFSHTRVQHSPCSLTIEPPPALAKSGTYSPDRACHSALAHAAAPYEAFRDSAACPSCAPTPRRARNLCSEEAHRGWTPSSTKQTATASQPTG